jgi:XTP/dITP diphosphohydrolase
MATTIFVASGNPGKLRDFSEAAKDVGSAGQFTILPLPGIESMPPAPEEEHTFEGNARSKAEYYSRLAPGQLVLADDSGLEVPALDGLPGVRSARYALDAGVTPHNGETLDHSNNRLLLAQMRDIPSGKRSARYRCVLALAKDGGTLLTAEGDVRGEILTAAQGNGGFGYDPLFYLPSLGKTMAEIDLQEKHGLSHRGAAFRALLQQIRDKTH